MPNLMPDWTLTLPGDLGDFNVRAAGRLLWSLIALAIGLAIVIALIKPPMMKRPYSAKVGAALFPVIIVVGLVGAKALPSIQRGIVWLMILALVAHMLGMIASRAPRNPDQKATWAECFAGATGVFAILMVAYAIFPHEWLTFANADLEWGDSSKFVFTSDEKIFGLFLNYPFALDFPALRDIVVTVIYVVILGLNLKLWVMWQHRFEVKAVAEDADGTPARRSRFGRPLQAWSAQRAERTGTASAGATGDA